MQARLGTMVCKFGGDPAIYLVEEAICAKFTDGQTDGRRTPRDCISSWNELKVCKQCTRNYSLQANAAPGYSGVTCRLPTGCSTPKLLEKSEIFRLSGTRGRVRAGPSLQLGTLSTRIALYTRRWRASPGVLTHADYTLGTVASPGVLTHAGRGVARHTFSGLAALCRMTKTKLIGRPVPEI